MSFFFLFFSYLVLKWFALPHTIYLTHVFTAKEVSRKKKTTKRFLVHYKPIAYLILKKYQEWKRLRKREIDFMRDFCCSRCSFPPCHPATLPVPTPVFSYYMLPSARKRETGVGVWDRATRRKGPAGANANTSSPFRLHYSICYSIYK